jgi:hypothetical protein
MPSTPARAGTTAVAAVAAAVLMLVLVTWAAAIGPEHVFTGGGTFIRDSTAPIASSVTESVRPDLQDEVREKYGAPAPAWVRLLALVVEVAVLVVVLYLLGRLLRRILKWWKGRERRRHLAPPPALEFEVLDPMSEVAAAIEDDAVEQQAVLEAGEPRNAIVACWRRFEAQAARVDVVRRPWQTSSEFVLSVLDRIGAEESAVLRLATLFREARFSDHPITEQHRDEAVAALAAIHGSLRRAREISASGRRTS